jgi:hypothetical protein
MKYAFKVTFLVQYVEGRNYSMCVNVLQQIKIFGTVPGSGFDYAQSLIKQNKHTNGVPVIVLQLFVAKMPPPQLSNTYKELCINALFVCK